MMSIAETLIDISNESSLSKAEKVSLKLIAKDVKVKDELLQAYREKRMYDGLNGRVWHSEEHWEAEQRIRKLEGA